jgi:hypothetical protein
MQKGSWRRFSPLAPRSSTTTRTLDVAALRLARGAGLLALDLIPPLRHFVARRMMFGARAWP